MTNLLDKIPEHIKLHIKEITKTSGLPDSEESIQELMDAWVEKENAESSRNNFIVNLSKWIMGL